MRSALNERERLLERDRRGSARLSRKIGHAEAKLETTRFITPLQKQGRLRSACGPRAAALERGREARSAWGTRIESDAPHLPPRAHASGSPSRRWARTRMRDEKAGCCRFACCKAQAARRRQLRLVDNADDNGENSEARRLSSIAFKASLARAVSTMRDVMDRDRDRKPAADGEPNSPASAAASTTAPKALPGASSKTEAFIFSVAAQASIRRTARRAAKPIAAIQSAAEAPPRVVEGTPLISWSEFVSSPLGRRSSKTGQPSSQVLPAETARRQHRAAKTGPGAKHAAPSPECASEAPRSPLLSRLQPASRSPARPKPDRLPR